MMEKILTRKCFKLEWKWFGLCAVFLGSYYIFSSTSFCSVHRPYMEPLPIIEVIPHENSGPISPSKVEVLPLKKSQPIPTSKCNFSGKKSDFCDLHGDIRIHANSSSIYFNSPQLANQLLINNTWTINLHARKEDRHVMGLVKELHLKPLLSSHQQEAISKGVFGKGENVFPKNMSFKEFPECTTTNHSLPAIVFNMGGYSGNIFHAATDVLIPLYLTSFQFNGEVQLLAQDYHPSRINKHKVFFKGLSKYEIINFNRDNEIRCFNHVIVGLKAHHEFLIDPKMDPFGLTLRNYSQFNRKSYSLERETAIKITENETRKPRLLIISRKRTRTILNEDELAQGAQSLGYEVEIMDASMELKNFSKIVNSADVMMGVHGAGLTNMVYLPENAVLIQVVGLGMQAVSRISFEHAAKAMNLRYMKYEIGAWESSLIEQYPSNHQVITNPRLAVKGKGWHAFKNIYLDKQDVRLDMSRFRKILIKALGLLSS